MIRVRQPFTGETFSELSIYSFDPPAKSDEIASLIAQAMQFFNIPNDKGKFFMLRVIKKGWSKRHLEDAIDNAFDTYKIPTKNSGMEPGVILSFDRKVKLYNYHESIGQGLKHVNIKGLSGHWWIDEIDYLELKKTKRSLMGDLRA